jgi:hypothetical protein
MPAGSPLAPAQRSSWMEASCREEERWLSGVWIWRYRMSWVELGDLDPSIRCVRKRFGAKGIDLARAS